MPSVFRRFSSTWGVLLLGVFAQVGSASGPTVVSEREGRNASVFRHVLDSDGFYAIRERRMTGEGPDESADVIGILVVEKGSLRFLVTWPIGVGRRATYSAIVSQRNLDRYVYSGIRYEGKASEEIAYDLSCYDSGLTEFSDTVSRDDQPSDELSSFERFTLESRRFTDFWQRVP